MKHHVWISALVLALGAVSAHGQAIPFEREADRLPTIQTRGNCVIRGARVLTVTKGTIENGDVYVKNGKIAAVGTALKVPPGTIEIDGRGKVLAPGIVDAHVHRGSDSTNEGTDSITCEVRILDVLNPNARNVWQALASGETTGLILHGSANAVGGESVVAKFKYGRTSREMPVPDAPRMVKFALGENVTGSSRNNTNRFPRTRMGVEVLYRRAFTEARKYKADWDAYQKAKSSNPKLSPPRYDIRLQTLSDILDRKVWVQCHSYRADEILMLLRLSQEYGFKIGAFQHALEAYKIAPELAKAGVGVSVFADLWAFKLEGYDGIPYNAAICTRAGVLTSVNTDGTGGTTTLNIDAGKMMRFGGLSEVEALRLITINPAKQLGVAHRLGSIEVGKDADLVLWQGHPLSVYSKAALTMIEGEVFFQRRDAWGVDPLAPLRTRLDPMDTRPTPALPKTSKAYAIVGADLYPVSRPVIPNGTIVVRDGKIQSIFPTGARPKLPGDVTVIDGTGLRVFPGFIDGGNTLGLDEIDGIGQMNDSRELGDFQPDLLAITAQQGESPKFNITRSGGITTALVRPAGGVISGRAGLINLVGTNWEERRMKSPAALAVNLPSVGFRPPRELDLICCKEAAGNRYDMYLGGGVHRHDDGHDHDHDEDLDAQERAPRNQGAAEETPSELRALEEQIERAKKYAADRRKSPRPAVDLTLEAMVPYVEGREPVLLQARTASSIRAAVAFAKKHGLKIVLVGAQDAWREAKLLADNKVPVILGLAGDSTLFANAPTVDTLPYDTPFVVPSILQKAGVKYCFQSNDDSQAFALPFKVGQSMTYGLRPDHALRAFTLSAAEILGVANQLGSLDTGKMGNLVVVSGDPFETTGRVRYLFIKGQPVPLENRFTQLRDKYLQRLTPAQRAAMVR